MTTWRYIAQRATTGEFLEFEVPFVARNSLTWSLSAAGSFKGSVAPETGLLTAPDGRPLFEEWNTLIYAEADGQIRWGGIVIRSEADDDAWEIEAASFATYPAGMPYLGEFYAAETDPADIIREIWNHLQGFERGDLGVTVTGSTNVRVGSQSEAAAKAAADAYTAAKAVYDAARNEYTRLRAIATDIGRDLTARRSIRTDANAALTAAKKTKDPAQIAAAQAQVDAANANVAAGEQRYAAADSDADTQAAVRDAAKATLDARAADKKAATADMKDDGGAYKLSWWDAPDCGAKINDLVKATPLDYVEAHSWNAEKSAVNHTIQVQYPRAGRRRNDLAFILGDNVREIAAPKSNGDDYANEIFGLGNGTGDAMVHTSTAVDDGRVRRVNVINNKDVDQEGTLQSLARDALLKAAANLSIDDLQVVDHVNAPIGSWALGDDIYVQADLPWVGRVGIWHRIVAWSLDSDSTATLKLERSDSFSYGK